MVVGKDFCWETSSRDYCSSSDWRCFFQMALKLNTGILQNVKRRGKGVGGGEEFFGQYV